MEKIHGTSAHVCKPHDNDIRFFAGGEKHENFVKLFDQEALKQHFAGVGLPYNCTIYGEAYGGKQQEMSATYGKELRFIAFEVKIGDRWLSVPEAEAFVLSFCLEFVPYHKVPATLEALNAERDRPSEIAVRRGILEPKKREGIVIRPLIELCTSNGDRIMAKHKGDDFKETKTPREVDPAKLQVLADANAIADEWVVEERLNHVLCQVSVALGLGGPDSLGVEHTGEVIKEMVRDIMDKEAKGEVVESKEARQAIGKKTAIMFKARIQQRLEQTQG